MADLEREGEGEELVGVLRFGLTTDKRKEEAGSVGSIYIDHMSAKCRFSFWCAVP